MYYLKDYREGQKFVGTYLCKQKNVLKTKAGKTYYSLILQDKTGTVDGKIWELNNGIENFEAMDFIHCRNGNQFSGKPADEYFPRPGKPGGRVRSGGLYAMYH